MIDMLKRNRKNILNMVIIFCYAIVSFIMMIHHEPWRDEAQQWLIIRDLNFSQIIAQMKYEGHFLLWYMILFPFVKLGFPYITANIISWAICVIAVSIIILKAPFKTWIKILFILTVPMIYMYPAISRCYCLIPLAISLVALAYKNRKTKPILYILSIVLLLNTHVIMLGLVGILLLLFFIEQVKDIKNMTLKEKRKFILSLIIGLILSLLSILPIMRSIGTNDVVSVQLPKNAGEVFYRIIETVYIYWYYISFIEISNSLILITVLIFLGILTTMLIIYESKRSTNNLLLLVISIEIQIIFYTLLNFFFGIKFSLEHFVVLLLVGILITMFIMYESKRSINSLIILFTAMIYQRLLYMLLYGASLQRLYSFMLIFLFVMWIQKYNLVKKEEPKVSKSGHIGKFIIAIFLISNVIGGSILFIYPEMNFNYSSSKETSIFINNNLPNNSIILCNNTSKSLSIIPYTKNVEYYSLPLNEKFTYVIWKKNVDDVLNDNYMSKLKDIKNKYNNVYYLLAKSDRDEYIKKLEGKGTLVPIFESKNSSVREDYVIYDIVL